MNYVRKQCKIDPMCCALMLKAMSEWPLQMNVLVKATTGVCEAHLHLSYTHSVIRGIPSQTNGNVIVLSPDCSLH